LSGGRKRERGAGDEDSGGKTAHEVPFQISPMPLRGIASRHRFYFALRPHREAKRQRSGGTENFCGREETGGTPRVVG
jgi:hypothetical protein